MRPLAERFGLCPLAWPDLLLFVPRPAHESTIPVLAELFGWLTLCPWNPYFRRICDFPSVTGLLQLLLSDLRNPFFSGGDPFFESENHRPLAFLFELPSQTQLSTTFLPFLRLKPRLTYLLVTKAPLCGRTSTSLWDRIPQLYHFHESPSMRYTFAPTSTLCPTDCARTAGAETGWCFAGSRKSGFSVSCFFFCTGGCS